MPRTTTRQTTRPDPPDTPRPDLPDQVVMPLLDRIVRQSLDEDYQVAAARKVQQPPRPTPRVATDRPRPQPPLVGRVRSRPR